MVGIEDTFSLLRAMDFLTKNFPNNILIPVNIIRKEYDSVYDFILELMKILGIEPMELIYALTSHITGFSEKAVENYRKTMDKFSEVEINDENPWIEGINETMKYVILTSLSGLLSCSANPIIKSDFLDARKTIKGEGEAGITNEDGIDFSLDEIDPFGFLDLCPVSDYGKNFYSDNKYGLNELYKSSDFNAFLWYCIHKSERAPQKEMNKCMWDNRYKYRYRRTAEEWESWLGSKTKRFFDKDDNGSKLKQDGKEEIKPILQAIYQYDTLQPLKIQLSSQSYYRSRKFISAGKAELSMNKTMFEFDRDYLDSIQIFSAKTFVNGFMNAFINGMTMPGNPITINRVLPREMIRKIIESVIHSESTGEENCYFTFSNEDFDRMLNDIELKKFNGKPFRTATGTVTGVDKEYGKKEIDSLLSPKEEEGDNDATFHDERQNFIKTVRNLSAVTIPGEDGKVSVDFSNYWLEDFFTLLLEQALMPIFSPKIIFLFALHYKEMGGADDITIGLILKNFISIIISLCRSIIKSLLRFVAELLFGKLMKIVLTYKTMMIMEAINDYMRLLDVSIVLVIPKVHWFANAPIEDVNYADIIPEKTTPETKKDC